MIRNRELLSELALLVAKYKTRSLIYLSYFEKLHTACVGVDKVRNPRYTEVNCTVAKMDCVKELLNVMDTFERALEAPCTDENYKKGVELTFAQIQKAFEKLGVTEIAALGETFDPNLHNAIKQVDDSEYESDKVCEVFQKGYLLGDRLIRPAMVAVSV